MILTDPGVPLILILFIKPDIISQNFKKIPKDPKKTRFRLLGVQLEASQYVLLVTRFAQDLPNTNTGSKLKSVKKKKKKKKTK